MDEKEEIKRGRGKHLKKNEAKIEILKYIIDNDGPVIEPDIREHLKKTFGIKDTKTIKLHFKDLQKLQCIKKISNSGKENEWRIDSIKQLNNIKENFKGIDLHCYKRPIEILVSQFTSEIELPFKGIVVSPDESTIRAYLRMSPTFFDLCMSIDIIDLYERCEILEGYSREIGSQANAKGMDLNYSLVLSEGSDPASDSVSFDIDSEGKLNLCAYDDFIQSELPYLAFKQCVYMDILTGKYSTMSTNKARMYIVLKESATLLWNQKNLEKYAKSHGIEPSDVMRNSYLEYSRQAEDYIKDLKIK
jgi:hypothetical protein